MEFQFGSLQEFLFMEGHGSYVWAAYIITLIGIGGLALKAKLARKSFFAMQSSIAKRNSQSAPEPMATR